MKISIFNNYGMNGHRRTTESALRSVGDILSDGKVPSEQLAWHLIRAQHTSALRGRMLRLFAPTTTNRYLTAVRGVLKASWRLELIDRDIMEQALDVTPARGTRAIRGRVVDPRELVGLFKICARDALFNQISKAGKVRPSGITAQLIYHIVWRRHVETGIKPFTPHDLRRSFISELLDEGVDLVTVARQVGHANVQTTARYDRRDDTTQQRGVLRLKVPFVR